MLMEHLPNNGTRIKTGSWMVDLTEEESQQLTVYLMDEYKSFLVEQIKKKLEQIQDEQLHHAQEYRKLGDQIEHLNHVYKILSTPS